MTRRFERRGTEAPMDFEYEKKDRDLGPWLSSVKRLTSSRQDSPTFGSSTSQSAVSSSNGFAQSSSFIRHIPSTSHSAPVSTTTSTTWTPSGLQPQNTTSPQDTEEGMEDISMSTVQSETPSPRKIGPAVGSNAHNPSPSRRTRSLSPIQRHRRSRERDREEDKEGDKGAELGVVQGVVSRRNKIRDTEDWEGSQHETQLRKGNSYNTHYTFHMPNEAGNSSAQSTPHMLAEYFQVTFNASVLLLLGYLVVNGLLTVRKDVDDKLTEYSSELLQEIAVCSQLYLANKCHPDTRVPAMERTCIEWERCMNRDPKVIGRARVYMETLAEMTNGFFGTISLKTFIYSLIGVLVFVLSANLGLSIFRTRHEPPPSVIYSRGPTPLPPMLEARGPGRQKQFVLERGTFQDE